MGVHVPESLLRVSKSLKLEVQMNSLTDRQIKNIVKQVRAGFVPMWANSATAHIARHIVDKFELPCIKWSSYNIKLNNIPEDHPIFEAIINAGAISKLELTDDQRAWHTSYLERDAEAATIKNGNYTVSPYHYSNTGRDMITQAGKKGVVTPDSPVHEYLNKLMSREIKVVEMELS